jgi:hypothetical protein
MNAEFLSNFSLDLFCKLDDFLRGSSSVGYDDKGVLWRKPYIPLSVSSAESGALDEAGRRNLYFARTKRP